MCEVVSAYGRRDDEKNDLDVNTTGQVVRAAGHDVVVIGRAVEGRGDRMRAGESRARRQRHGKDQLLCRGIASVLDANRVGNGGAGLVDGAGLRCYDLREVKIDCSERRGGKEDGEQQIGRSHGMPSLAQKCYSCEGPDS